MEVIDLSMPKSSQQTTKQRSPTNTYPQTTLTYPVSPHQIHYIPTPQTTHFQNQNNVEIPVLPQNRIPTQPSVGHLGVFQQIHYSIIPEIASFRSPKRLRTDDLPQNSLSIQPPINQLGLIHQAQCIPQTSPCSQELKPLHSPAFRQPSADHIGFFEQMQYAATPQNENQQGLKVPLSPQKAISMHSPDSSKVPIIEGSPQTPSKFPVNRPFKALSVAKSTSLPFGSALDPEFEAEFEKYRKQVLASMPQPSSGINKNMRRYNNSDPKKCSDPDYLEKRKKNNEAAKKSREARKDREDELAIRVGFLENENLKMKFQLAAVEKEKKMLLMRRGMKGMQYVDCRI